MLITISPESRSPSPESPCGKRLWNNTLMDDPLFYEDKLYRSLRKSDSPFVLTWTG